MDFQRHKISDTLGLSSKLCKFFIFWWLNLPSHLLRKDSAIYVGGEHTPICADELGLRWNLYTIIF